MVRNAAHAYWHTVAICFQVLNVRLHASVNTKSLGLFVWPIYEQCITLKKKNALATEAGTRKTLQDYLMRLRCSERSAE